MPWIRVDWSMKITSSSSSLLLLFLLFNLHSTTVTVHSEQLSHCRWQSVAKSSRIIVLGVSRMITMHIHTLADLIRPLWRVAHLVREREHFSSLHYSKALLSSSLPFRLPAVADGVGRLEPPETACHPNPTPSMAASDCLLKTVPLLLQVM